MDFIAAVSVGVVLASLAFVKMLANDELIAFGESKPTAILPEERELLERAKIEFAYSSSVARKVLVRQRIPDIRFESAHIPRRAVVLDLTCVSFIDVSAARAVETIACDVRHLDKTVHVSGISEEVKETLAGLRAPITAHATTRTLTAELMCCESRCVMLKTIQDPFGCIAESLHSIAEGVTD